MDDDGGDWFGGGDDEPAPAEVAKEEAAKESAPAGDVTAAPADGTAEGDAAGEQPPLEAATEEYLDPDKFLLFKHWIRPKFLQYNYLYNYRHNYYDDVIDYLDKRQKGLSRDVPRAQTWAERVLRSSTDKKNREDYFKTIAEDTKLVSNCKLSGSFFHYHSKQYVNRRYSSILY